MRMPPFELHTPTSLDEAISISHELISENQEFDWVAGGTDLLPNYKWHLNVKPNVISLSKISELTELNETHIGAMVRRSGPVGGNICLDTRCYWFNQTEQWRESIDWCHKCDCGTEADCRVIPNQNTLCVATYQADLAPVLMCLGAVIHLAGPNGIRSMPLSEFFQLDGMTRNVLQPGELVTHLTLPEDVAEWHGDYQKLRQRESWDFPEAGVAAVWKKNGTTKPTELKVATTGLESIPMLHTKEVDSCLNSWSGAESINELAESIRKSVKPVQNTWFSPSYRRKMVKVLTRRACAGLVEGDS